MDIIHSENTLEDSDLIQKCSPKPFVKWVGGKRNILSELLKKIPKNINNYYEPFVGGGALFFEVYQSVNYCYLSDLNVDLVVAYNINKTKLDSLINLLKKHQKSHKKEYFYYIRSQQSLIDPLENTARFIYLMKTCYNGLYRVNKKNEFNTPMGSYTNPIICDEINLRRVAKALQKADIKYGDFTKITPKKGDFVYFDPPYYPTNENSFTKYVRDGFSEKEQIRLRDFALDLTRNGINVMISNSNSEVIINIYKKNFKVDKILASRVISCKGNKRNPVFETLITNY